MRISDLMQDIIDAAEDKFGYEDHNNDGISIAIFHTHGNGGEWQVSLERPTLPQLENGQVEDVSTIKTSDSHVGFYTEGTTLLVALRELQQKVTDAYSEDWVR